MVTNRDIKVEPSPITEKLKNNGKKKTSKSLQIFYKQVIVISVVSVILFIVAIGIITAVAESSRPKVRAEKSIGTSCRDSAECDKRQELVCMRGKCACEYNYEHKNGVCREKTLGKVCLTNSSCRANANLTCVNGLCSCLTTSYWNGTSCVQKGSFNATCQVTIQCLPSVECSNGLCGCTAKNYWNGTFCVKKIGVNGTCSNSNQCDDSRFLACYNGRCGCNSTVDAQGNVELYSNEDNVCLKCPNGFRLSGDSCYFINRTLMTQPQAKTYCESFGAHLFSIDNDYEYDLITSVYHSYINGQAWVGIESLHLMIFRRHTNRKLLNNSVSWWASGRPDSGHPNSPCVSIGFGNTSRLDDDNCISVRRMPFCQKYSSPCPLSTLYWNGESCVNKAGLADYCNSSQECDQAYSLICEDGFCGCDITSFRNESSCFPKNGINGTCSDSNQCDDSRSLACYNGRCGCNSTVDAQGNVELYSNEANVCLKCPSGWRLSGDSCYFVNRTLMTQPQAKSYCESFDSHLIAIQNQIEYNLVSSVYPSYINGLAWVGIESFRQMIFTRHFDRTVVNNSASWWAPSQPQNAFPSNTCVSIGISNTSRLSVDNCVTVSRMPMCQKYSSPCTETTFWNGSACLQKKSIDTVCSSSQECAQYESLVCLNGVCSCDTDSFRSGSSCSPKQGINGTCSNNSQCDDSRFLACYNGRCGCNSTVDAQGNVEFYSIEDNVCLKCPNGWRVAGDYCYFINRTLMTQPQARAYCGSFDAHLIALKSQEEYNQVSGFYPSYINGLAWLGVEAFNMMSFRRIFDRTIFNNSASWWASGRPDSGHPNSPCVSIGFGNTSRLDDDNCVSVRRMPFCQKYSSPCTTSTFWNGTLCLQVKGIDSMCTSNFECDQAQTLICVNGMCGCDMTRFRSGSTCVPKTGLNGTCSDSNQCDDSRSLACYNGRCGCNSTVDAQGNVELYSNEANVCLKCPSGWRLSGDSCYFVNRTLMTQPQAKSYCESFDSHLIAIQNQIEYNLVSSVYPSYINGLAWVGIESFRQMIFTRHFDRTVVNNSASWWAPSQPQNAFPSNTCVSIGISNTSRLSVDNCVTVSRMPMCQKYSSPCTETTFWNGSACLQKKSIDTVCSTSQECAQYESLVCLNGVCSCDTDSFRSGSSCSPKQGINGTCSNNNQCDDSRFLACYNGRCGCNSTVDAQGNVELYSNEDNVCLKCPSGWRVAGDYCYFINRTLMTQPQARAYCGSLGAHLFALKSQEEYNQMSGFYPSYINGLAWIGLESTRSFLFRRDFDGTLLVNSTSWWASGTPDSGHPGDPCVSVGISNTPRLDDNNCLAYSRMPLCQRYSSPCTLTTYWNGILCLQKKFINDACNSSSECADYQSLICNNGVCGCETSRFYNGSACVPKLGLNGTCTSNVQCDDLKFYVCNSGRCGCNSAVNAQGNYDVYSNEANLCLTCPNGWRVARYFCYFIHRVAMTQPNARTYCESFGGYLYFFKNHEEYNLYTSIYPTYINSFAWFGLESTGGLTYARHFDRTVLYNDIEFWQTGEPNGGHPAESCVSVSVTDPLRLNDVSCTLNRFPLCQKYVNPCQDYTYWNNTSCVLKKGFNTACWTNLECDESQMLVCLDGVCRCRIGTYRSGSQCIQMRQYGNNFYRFDTTKRTFADAVAYCRSINMWSYTPNTRAEHDWVMHNLINNYGLGDVWTGCTSQSNQGQFLYTCQGTPNPVRFTNTFDGFCGGEPGLPNTQLCISSLLVNGCPFLDDNFCSALLMPVCESDPF